MSVLLSFGPMNENVTFESLSRSAKELSAMVIMESADFIFKLWPDGEIAHAAFGNAIRTDTDPQTLVHQSIQQLVVPEDAAPLTAILENARAGRTPTNLKVRHSDLVAQGMLVRYTAHLSSDGRNIMLIGRAVAAQLSLAERAVDAEIVHCQNAGFQRAELRYRNVFSASSEGSLVMDASGRIEEANFNASRLLAQAPEDLLGTSLTDHFADQNGGILRSVKKADDFVAELDNRILTIRETEASVSVSCQKMDGFKRELWLLRITPVAEEDTDARTVEFLEKTSIPVFLADRSGRLTWNNDAFGVLVPNRELTDTSLVDVLGVSVSALESVMAGAEASGRLITSLSAMDGTMELGGDAHLWWVNVPSSNTNGYGVLMHFASASNANPLNPDYAPEHDALAQMVGEAPMKSLVRRSTELLERNCIEAALRLTGNNRAAAASVLGLSRQSLYLKLHQHDLL